MAEVYRVRGVGDDLTDEQRRFLAVLAIVTFGALGTELSTRGLLAMNDLPMPDDSPAEMQRKAYALLHLMDLWLNEGFEGFGFRTTQPTCLGSPRASPR